MTKFSGITPLSGPALADYLLGVTSGNVDFRLTLQNLITFLNTNSPYFWQELARGNTTTTVQDIATATFVAKKYLMVLGIQVPSGNLASSGVRFNGDTASNYAYRISDNGGADTTGSFAGIPTDDGGNNSGVQFFHFEIYNAVGQEKAAWGGGIGTNIAGLANPPRRREGLGKWLNTANQITQATLHSNATNLAAGSEIIVLGHD